MACYIMRVFIYFCGVFLRGIMRRCVLGDGEVPDRTFGWMAPFSHPALRAPIAVRVRQGFMVHYQTHGERKGLHETLEIIMPWRKC